MEVQAEEAGTGSLLGINSLYSLKGGYIEDYIGTTIGVIKGDTRSLGYSSFVLISLRSSV